MSEMAPATPAPGAVAPAPAATPAPQPAPAVPAPANDLQAQLDRANARVAGMQAYYDQGAALGIRDAAGWARLKAITDRGVSLDNIGRMFEQPAPARPQATPLDGGVMDQAAIDRLVEERMSGAFAERDHRAAETAAWNGLESGVRAWLGANANAADVAQWTAISQGVYRDLERSSFYEDGHPLASRAFKPVGFEAVQAKLVAMKQQFDAARLAAAGDAANGTRPAPASMIGAGGSPGAPGTQGAKPFSQQSRAERLAVVDSVYNRRMAQQNGGVPASQAT